MDFWLYIIFVNKTELVINFNLVYKLQMSISMLKNFSLLIKRSCKINTIIPDGKYKKNTKF